MKIVKYNNDLNNISFGNFKEKELDLFFSICYNLKEKGTEIISLDFSELKKLSNYANRNLDRFYKDLDMLYKKLIELNFRYEDEDRITRFVLFTKYEIDKKNKNVTIKVNEEFRHILNDLSKIYTKFELLEFVSLKSIYSKNMYKLLKQWESTKNRSFDIEELRYKIGVPENYDTNNFNKRILKPILEELPPFFPGLKIEKIKFGKKIVKFNFTWNNQIKVFEEKIEEVIISSELKTAIEKSKKNLYISKFLKELHIKELLEVFNEKDLIIGLDFAYKNINEDFQKLTYLENSIKRGIESKNLKIITENKSEIFVPIEATDEKIIKQERIKVSKEEYEKMFQDYLVEIKQKSGNKIVRNIFDMLNKNRVEIFED